VPSVLLSEFLTGVSAGVLHHEFGNVSFKPGSRPLKVALALAACSVVGTLAAVFIAASVPKWALKTYIGVLVLAMGVAVLLTLGKTFAFSWKKVIGLGLVAAFNKGLSGGGYGPLVTSGQILAGVDGKGAIGITSLAEGLVCIVGVIAYVLMGNGAVSWDLAPSLILGAMLSVPLAALTVKKVPVQKMRWAIGAATTVLGVFTLAKLVF
jgi:uncharacterized membrane protein YfcA